jgi:iron complex transport system ATP-binding protein
VTLEAASLSLRLGGTDVLRGVSVCVRPGRLLTALGPNGAGKTTLLRALSGELRPSGGALEMNGRPLGQWTIETRARVRAVMPHQTNLLFAFTGEEVVRLPHEGYSEARHDAWVARESLRAVDAAHLARRRFPELSAGERQRVALARALAQIWDPLPELGARYLLLDEPTSHLDLGHQHAIMARVRALAREGVGVIAVMHDLNLAAQYADEVIVMYKGRIAAQGSPEAAMTPETILRAYGTPATVIPHPQTARPVILPVVQAS